LEGDQRYRSIEQRDDAQKAAGNVFGDQNRTMIVLRIALLLDIPVLDRSDDVGFVCRAELNLDLISSF